MTNSTSSKKAIVAALMVTMFLISIEATIVSTAMPKIVSDLGGLQSMSWVFSAYLLTTVVSTPIMGKLLDLYGKKRIFLFGLLLFVSASALSGFAESMLQLIFFRAIQGIGAGALFPAVMTIIGVLFAQEERAKIQAGFGAISAISGLSGPFLGGIIVDYFSWQWIFFVNVPIGLVCFWLISASFHERFERTRISIDYAGAVIFLIASSTLLLSLSLGITYLLIPSAIAFAAFIYVESKAKDALIPPSLFANRMMTLCYLAAFLLSTLYIGMNVYVPLWMQGVAGSSATLAGLTLAPLSVMWSIGAYLCGVLLAKKGNKTVSLIGMVFIFAGVLALVVMGQEIPSWALIMVMAAIGLGMGFAATVFMVTIQSEADPTQMGSATATLTFLNYMAQSIGVALFAALFNREAMRGRERLTEQGIELQDFNQLLQFNGSHDLPASAIHAIRSVMSASISIIFVYVFAFVVIASIVVVCLPSKMKTEDRRQDIMSRK